METKVLKPAKGIKIRDPRTKDHLPEEGRLTEMSVYWRRRIQDGTVTVIESVEEKQTAIPQEEKKSKKGIEL